MRKINKRIHVEGNRAIIITFLVWAVVIVGINLLWPHQDWWHIVIYVIAVFVSALIVRFFRIPIHRKTTIMENAVISPADGEIAANEIVMEDEYFHEKRRQISIFMSIIMCISTFSRLMGK